MLLAGKTTLMNIKAIIQRHPLAAYFIIAFTIPWAIIVVIASIILTRGEPLVYNDGILFLPTMVLGPSIAGIALARIVDGKSGLQNLFSRMGRWRVGLKWYAAALLIPLVLHVAVLLALFALVSRDFALYFSFLGIPIGLSAGFFEEIGWMGYAFPKLCQKYSALTSSIIFLGILWGIWHLLVVDFLGAAYPHGAYWFPFFLSFVAIATALRVIIVWIYVHTKSVLLSQLMHASNTGFLAMLAPIGISPAQETLSYAVYAVILWVVAAIIIARYGKNLVRQPLSAKTVETPTSQETSPSYL